MRPVYVGYFFYNILCSLFYPPPPSLYYFGVYMFDVKKDMSPLNYALQYEMSKKLSKLLYTVDDDIMNVEPLVGDSNYNSVATVKRNGKITRVKYNRNKLDDTLNKICLAKQTDDNGTMTYTCLTPFVGNDDIGSIPEDWDAEQNNEYLKSYELTWNRTMNNIMDTDNKVFNLTGNRKPVGLLDVARDIIKLEGNAYIIRNIENTIPYGTLAIEYGEQVSFKIPFNEKYSHTFTISNGTISKKIGAYNYTDITDNKNMIIVGTIYSGGWISHRWIESPIDGNFNPVIGNDSSVIYTIRYDSNGVNIIVTDDEKTTTLERYETLSDKVFINLMFEYKDNVVSPASRPEINFTLDKQVNENAPALSTLTFPLPYRVGRGRVTYKPSGETIITPIGGDIKECILNYRCLPGINRLKFPTETSQVFNSKYLNEITIGLNQYGIEEQSLLPYLKFTKQLDGNWQMVHNDQPGQVYNITNDNLKNLDITYNSLQKDFVAYALTDPNDTSLLNTEPVGQTPNTYLLSDNRNFNTYTDGETIFDLVVRLKYVGDFDVIPPIKTTRYTPGPSKTKFNFSNKIYTTIGDNCTTHYGSTTYPVTFAKRISLEFTEDFKLGYYKVDAMANIIGNENVFVMGLDVNWYNLPNRRRLIITTERLTVADLMAGKYQGVVIAYSGVEIVESGGTAIVKYNKREMVNTLPTVFTLKESTDNDSNSPSDIDRIPHMLQLLGNDSNQYVLHHLLVDISATEYFIYDISQDYAYNPADGQS